MSLTVAEILDIVSEEFEIAPADLLGRWGSPRQVGARHALMALAYAYTPHSHQEVGAGLGGLDPATVRHAVRSVRRRVNGDPGFAAVYANAEERCRAQVSRTRIVFVRHGGPVPDWAVPRAMLEVAACR
ncbi:helix-turn-helix domain-containing protein [Sagittula sp.]|uniref:helix-turn-helix domain-containing protein n=1 Tax=Sagittula sp. TaxID=2038081 RepID=UPI003513CC5E